MPQPMEYYSILVAVVLSFLQLSSSSLETVYPSSSDVNDTRTDLYIGLIQAFGFNNSFNGSGVVPAIQLALDNINDDQNILPGYKLNYVLMDSQCNHNVALDALFKQIISEVPKVGIIGSGCSVATEPTAEISHYYNITQLSCVSSSHFLANRQKYRAYFQMLPTDINLVPSIVAVCEKYNWRHIAIIQQEENIFEETIDDLTQLFNEVQITYNLTTFSSSSGPLSLQPNLFDSRSRIFFLAMYSSHARTVICEAYKIGLHYPKNIFIIYGWYSPRWWIPPPSSSFNCTKLEIEFVLEHSIAVLQHQFTSNTSAPTNNGISYLEYDIEYRQRILQLGYNYSAHGIQCFDGIWAFAFALNNTITELMNNETLSELAFKVEGVDDYSQTFRIENATYKNYIIQQTMFKYLSQTNFLGISDEVTFDESGIRTVNKLRIFQYRNGTNNFHVQVIATVLPINRSFTYLPMESDETVWQNGNPPYDGTPNIVVVSVPIPVTVIFSLLSLCGIAFAIGCLIFLIVFRNNKFIKLASPSLNYIIIIGAVMMYISVILYVIPTFDEITANVFCNLPPRIYSLSYVVCFGTILAKTWRIYYIFTNPKPNKKKFTQNWVLIIFIIALVLVNICLTTILVAFPGGRTESTYGENAEKFSEEIDGFVYNYYSYVCTSLNYRIFLGIVFGFKALLQIAALFLAFGIRKVKVKGLKDSKFIGLAVYMTSITLTIQIIFLVTLTGYIITFACIFTTCILLTATIILAVTFIPQMYCIYKDPKGEKIFHEPNENLTVFNTMVTTTNNDSINDIINDSLLSDQQKLEKLSVVLQETLKKNKDMGTNFHVN